MKVTPLYLDTCIFVAYYYDKDSRNKHQRIIDCLEKLKSHKNIQLVTSDFTFTEFLRIVKKLKGFSMKKGYKIVNELTRLNKIGKKYQFKMVEGEDIENAKEYTLNDFFVSLQEEILNQKKEIGIPDSIHIVVMRNNKLKNILTFDTNNGFNNIKKINAINPNDIDDFITKISK
ncbi:type II toxin-antitoxin system VapC family toxin [Patescibacteria group bacterium]|nr:type II toxin-antitoxin system VapC family toxin [Nanoarchaeota archaeon]MBU1706007.1 type II toxin-antitoxin system VapC family toxin [Patescibacteria group bacterium]